MGRLCYYASVVSTSYTSSCRVFIDMLFNSDLAFILWSFRLPTGLRVFHQIPIVILTTASLAYFSMASDLGATPIATEFRAGGATRAIWVSPTSSYSLIHCKDHTDLRSAANSMCATSTGPSPRRSCSSSSSSPPASTSAKSSSSFSWTSS